ncbi:MAG: cytochrome c [Bacteroidota bacterium]|nr:cytochrome c [Bacteroidota bacterium]
MKKIVVFSAVAVVCLFFIQSCGNDTSPKENVDSGTDTEATISASVNGKELYEEKCQLCHGGDGKQNTMGAADLSTSTLDHAVVTTIITSGKNSMKAFSPELNGEQIEAVAKYVETLRK